MVQLHIPSRPLFSALALMYPAISWHISERSGVKAKHKSIGERLEVHLAKYSSKHTNLTNPHQAEPQASQVPSFSIPFSLHCLLKSAMIAFVPLRLAYFPLTLSRALGMLELSVLPHNHGVDLHLPHALEDSRGLVMCVLRSCCLLGELCLEPSETFFIWEWCGGDG